MAGELSATEAAILGLLSRTDATGYELRKYVQRTVGYFWAPAKSHVYSVLAKLVDRGFATREHVAQAHRPDKQIHRITLEGRQALRAWLASSEFEVEAIRNTFLLKLFFGPEAGRGSLVPLVEAYLASMRAELEEYRAIEQRLRGREDDYFGYLT